MGKIQLATRSSFLGGSLRSMVSVCAFWSKTTLEQQVFVGNHSTGEQGQLWPVLGATTAVYHPFVMFEEFYVSVYCFNSAVHIQSKAL